jgi:hypothetical protein
MAMTPEQAKQQEQEFSAGYAEDQQKAPEQSEDEAFGLSPETPAQEAAEPAAEEAKETPAQESSEQAQAAEGGADGDTGNDQGTAPPEVAVAPDAADGSNVGEEPTDPKDIQRQKSWEGRLKAKEAELKAREDALKGSAKPEESTAEMKADGDTPAEEAAEPAVTEKLEEVAEQVKSGDMSTEEAMKTLSSDFGEDFVKMLNVLIEAKSGEVASKTADEKVGAVSGKLDGLIGELVDDKAKSHFESISEAHPDFMEVGESPEFKAYVDALPATEKEHALNVIGSGSAGAINKLLTVYKKSKEAPTQEKPDESAMDAAEGVRGKAIKLPDHPDKSEGYEEAWNQF